MKTMLGYLKPYWIRMLFSGLALTMSGLCDLLLPTVMSDLLNQGVYGRDFQMILLGCGKMLLFTLLGVGCQVLGSLLSTRVVANYCADLRRAVFQRVNRMDFETFGSIGTAALVTRATKDVQTVSWLAVALSDAVITIPVLFFGGVGLTMAKDWVLALAMLAFLPLVFLLVTWTGKRINPLWEESDGSVDRQNELIRQRLRGIRVIRAFQREGDAHEQVASATRVMSRAMISANNAESLIAPVTTFLLNAAAVLVVYLGIFRLEGGTGLTGPDLFAIVQYIALTSGSVINAAFVIIEMPHARVAAERIGQALRAPIQEEPAPREELTLEGSIRLEDVSFTYPGGAAPALEHISLTIPAGKKAAIIGGTGAGKTTLARLLLGFYPPAEGKIYLGGRDLSGLNRRTLRDQLSPVLQSAALYSGTIRENLRMGRPEALDEELWDALEAAQAGFVRELGLDHPVKQSGKNLSGGQKQRLCIARALLKNAPVYLFDDSFSALDFLTEAALRSALSKRLAGKTQILITQRISTAAHCDLVFVLDGGSLVGAGTHSQLLESCQVYREIYDSQTGGKEHG